MGRRSSFKRIPRDLYPTPAEALPSLLPHLRPRTRFCEPCAGDGRLARMLEDAGHRCVGQWDIQPLASGIERYDARTRRHPQARVYITNPPWTREVLHELIPWLSDHRPTWFLMDANWAFTKQARPFRDRCVKIVAVGRLKWFPDTPHASKDDSAWYLFDGRHDGPTEFVFRA